MKRLTVCLLAIVGLSACGVGVDDQEYAAATSDQTGVQQQTATTAQAATSSETRSENVATAPSVQVVYIAGQAFVVPSGDPCAGSCLPQDPQPTKVALPPVIK